MATKLSNGGADKAMTVSDILASKGAMLTSGFLDEHDREAMRQAAAISKARGLAPRKVGNRKAGFGRPAYHPNRAPYAFA
jgi:hypothetical protein